METRDRGSLNCRGLRGRRTCKKRSAAQQAGHCPRGFHSRCYNYSSQITTAMCVAPKNTAACPAFPNSCAYFCRDGSRCREQRSTSILEAPPSELCFLPHVDWKMRQQFSAISQIKTQRGRSLPLCVKPVALLSVVPSLMFANYCLRKGVSRAVCILSLLICLNVG